MSFSNAATPVRYPTIYDLSKKQNGSNLPSDLISGSRWISPITGRKIAVKDEKTKSYMKTEMNYFPIFSNTPKKDELAEKIAKAHFRELDRRAYEDFLSSSRTNWISNPPVSPPAPIEEEKPKPKAKRTRKTKLQDSALAPSPEKFRDSALPPSPTRVLF
jgi:hypothetical protein